MATPEISHREDDRIQSLFLNGLSSAQARRLQITNITEGQDYRRNLEIRNADARIRLYTEFCRRMDIPKLKIERIILKATPEKNRQINLDALRYVLAPDEYEILAREFNLNL